MEFLGEPRARVGVGLRTFFWGEVGLAIWRQLPRRATPIRRLWPDYLQTRQRRGIALGALDGGAGWIPRASPARCASFPPEAPLWICVVAHASVHCVLVTTTAPKPEAQIARRALVWCRFAISGCRYDTSPLCVVRDGGQRVLHRRVQCVAVSRAVPAAGRPIILVIVLPWACACAHPLAIALTMLLL
jgi:hypothetical protein